MTILLVALGGAAGAVVRYLTDALVAARFGRAFPWGTLLVNVVGSFLLGVVMAKFTGDAALFAGTGFCGALTTYSTFASESVGLLDEKAAGKAVANVVLSLTLGLAACALGVALG